MKWSEEGFSKAWPQWFEELDIKHKYLPVLVVAKDDKQMESLEKIWELGQEIGGVYADIKRVSKDEILELEPHVTPDVIAGLYADGHAIDIFPPELAIAAAENAVQNGVKIMLDTEVTGVVNHGDSQDIQTSNGSIQTKFVVNAAGKYAATVSDMAGPRDWDLQFMKTQLMILDRRAKGLVNTVLNFPATPGVIETVMPRDETVMVQCGTYDKTEDPEDVGTYKEGFSKGMSIAKAMIPEISEKDIIRSFMGIRAFNTRDLEDHIIEFSESNPNFLNVVIRLPGFIGAPPMAKHVVHMLEDAGLVLNKKNNFNPYRKAIPRMRDFSPEEQNEIIKKDANYGKIICNCEKVTEGEIIEAIKRGAKTKDGIKMRTRSGMGRCQGNFCAPHIMSIIARELNIPVHKVKKNDNGSFLISNNNK
jgi:glycerol-3-phosphate dehydrogenase